MAEQGKSNRTDYSALPPEQNKDLEKRGYHKYLISREDGVLVIKWKDKSVVSMVSNCMNAEPIYYVERYSQKGKKFT